MAVVRNKHGGCDERVLIVCVLGPFRVIFSGSRDLDFIGLPFLLAHQSRRRGGVSRW